MKCKSECTAKGRKPSVVRSGKQVRDFWIIMKDFTGSDVVKAWGKEWHRHTSERDLRDKDRGQMTCRDAPSLATDRKVDES